MNSEYVCFLFFVIQIASFSLGTFSCDQQGDFEELQCKTRAKI